VQIRIPSNQIKSNQLIYARWNRSLLPKPAKESNNIKVEGGGSEGAIVFNFMICKIAINPS
jgi:hypothetical protein